MFLRKIPTTKQPESTRLVKINKLNIYKQSTLEETIENHKDERYAALEAGYGKRDYELIGNVESSLYLLKIFMTDYWEKEKITDKNIEIRNWSVDGVYNEENSTPLVVQNIYFFKKSTFENELLRKLDKPLTELHPIMKDKINLSYRERP